jgi:hypothetical protein
LAVTGLPRQEPAEVALEERNAAIVEPWDEPRWLSVDVRTVPCSIPLVAWASTRLRSMKRG